MKRVVDAMMNRRTFLCTSACGLAGIPFASLAQTEKMPRVGALLSTNNYWEPSFWQGMRELGYIDGKTMVVERRSADGDFARLPALAAELAGRHRVVLSDAPTPRRSQVSRRRASLSTMRQYVGGRETGSPPTQPCAPPCSTPT